MIFIGLGIGSDHVFQLANNAAVAKLIPDLTKDPANSIAHGCRTHLFVFTTEDSHVVSGDPESATIA